MRLGRLISDYRIWGEFLSDDDRRPELMPAPAIASLIPSARDQGWLSLFQMEDDAESAFIAAALRFNQGKSDASYFVLVEDKALMEAGFTIVQSPGKTFHPLANDKHFAIEIRAPADLMRATQAFTSGQIGRVEKNPLIATLAESAANDQINCAALGASQNQFVHTRTFELLNSKRLHLRAGHHE